MNTLFETNDEIERMIFDISTDKAMGIFVDILQANEISLLQFNQKMDVN